MLYVYVETEQPFDGPELHSLCLGVTELDENCLVIETDADISYIHARAQLLANMLREGGAQVQLH